MFTLSPGRLFAPAPDLISSFLALPELRGFWPMSSVNESGNALDVSGQGRTLTNNAATPRAIYNALVPYFDLNGTTQYLSRADEAGLDITGALTFGGWFWFDTAATSIEACLGKRNTGVDQLSYYLRRLASGTINFEISNNGVLPVENVSSAAAVGVATWVLLVARFIPSTEIAVFVNELKATFATGFGAIFSGTAPLAAGADNAGTSFFNGRLGPIFICADDLPDDLIRSLYARTRGAFDV